MRLRFLIWSAVLASLLGVMLTIVVGHVRSAARDWREANYRMGEGAFRLDVLPNPDGEAPNPQRSAAINAQLRAVVANDDAVVVLDSNDEDGPRVGLHDPQGRLTPRSSSGRSLRASDFGKDTTTAMLRQGSYLLGREEGYIPAGVEIVGQFSREDTPFTQEYIYTLFSQENVHGTYYLDAEPETVALFEQALRRGDYLVSGAPIESNVLVVVQSEALTFAYEASLLLVYATALLLCLNWGAANRRRYSIEYRYGAYPLVFSLRMIWLNIIPVALGTALGATGAIVILRQLNTLSVVPGVTEILLISGANTVMLCGLFLVAITMQTRFWGR